MSRLDLRPELADIAENIWIRSLGTVRTAVKGDEHRSYFRTTLYGINVTWDSMNQQIERHIVLVAPEIHWNTGNIGRTCLATGASLHLVKPLGFSLDSREVQRAGLDYWDNVNLTLWDDFEELLKEMAPQQDEMIVFSKRGEKPFWSMNYANRLFLVFGSETRGLPEEILHRFSDRTYYIPIMAATRSLNLSTAAGIALYESLRHVKPFHAWPRRSLSGYQE
jgi:tRNA (cytidine/uridine-2'-O-)-methyltransferase